MKILKSIAFLVFSIVWVTADAQKTFAKLDELLNYAQTKSISLKSGEIKMSQAQKAILAAKLNIIDPTLNTNSSFTNNTQLPVNLFPAEVFGGEPGTYREVQAGVKYVTNLNQYADVKLLNLGAWESLKLAKINIETTASDNKLTLKNLYDNIAAAYFNIVNLQEQRASTQQNIAAAETLLRTAQNKYEQGLVKQQDVNDAKASLLNTQENAKQLAFLAQQNELSLKILCDIPENEAIEIKQSVENYSFSAPNIQLNDLSVTNSSLKAQIDGYLSAVNFEEGDIIPTGKIVAIVDNKESSFNNESAKELYDIAQSNTKSNAPALLQAQNSINLNKQKMEQDYIQYQRYKKLWENNTVAKIDFENSELQCKTSKTNYESALQYYKQVKQQANQQVIGNKVTKDINNIVLSKNQIKALKSGKIFKKYKQVGDYVTRGEAIALIGEPTNIYAKVNIDEGNIGKVKVGQEALVQLNTNKGKTYKGKVAEIYPSFDESTQSFICKITFNEPLEFTIVNTQLQSNIIVSINKSALLIPRNYMDFGGNVQIKDQKGKVKVTTQFASSDWVQVLSGIDENTVLSKLK